MKIVGRLLKDDRGIGAIEYALVASLISIAAVAGYEALGNKVDARYSKIDQALDGTL